MSESRRVYAILELLFAGALWGFGFVATKWALETLSAMELILMRFLVAGAVGLPFALWLSRRYDVVKKIKLSFWPAVFLMGTLAFQTWGLVYTTPTKSGFITTLYVVFVPLLEAAIKRKRIPAKIWLCVAGALLGTGLIVDVGFSKVNFGDVLTFISAIAAAGQIYWMGEVSPKVSRAFVFNVYQCFWSILIAAPFVDWPVWAGKVAHISEWPALTLIGVFSLALGSTLIAFYLQVRAQKQLSATVSSLMFLLESPFAMIFALLLLGQGLTVMESAGAFLIFTSAVFATFLETRPARN